MEPPALTDNELLSDWLEQGRELSFHALVSRYATLVHMAALRSCGNNDTLAAEAAQLTFILLARKAKPLATRRSLAGWLHLTAVMQVKNLVRQTRRETRKRQQLFSDMETDTDVSQDAAAAWREMRPVLDEALAALSAKDREALLLRFYRSLSVREIADTLGIATDAAQKRLNRATVRLRARLLRRGCQANGLLAGVPLTAVLLAGFAADSQAAAGPAASLLASRALIASAAATATGSAGISTLAKLTALKTSSLIPPAIALLLAAGWLIPKYTTLAAVQKENHALDQQLAAARIKAAGAAKPPTQKPDTPAASLKSAESLDWKELIALFTAKKRDIEVSMKRSLVEQELPNKVAGMTREELADALDTLLSLTQPMVDKQADALMVELGEFFMKPLLIKDPRFALEHFTQLLTGESRYNRFVWRLSGALGLWSQSDLPAASAWLDRQIAAGTFDSKTLSGENFARFLFASELFPAVLLSNPEEAARRLAALDEDQRRQVLTRSVGRVGEAGQAALINLARTQLQPEDTARVIANLAPVTYKLEDLPKAVAFMESIHASPEERTACVIKAAGEVTSAPAYRKQVTAEDLAGARSWIMVQAPGKVDNIMGELLWRIAVYGGLSSFQEMADKASAYDRESGGEEVLASFLENSNGDETREAARKLAASLRDGRRRAKVLEHLEPSPENPASPK